MRETCPSCKAKVSPFAVRCPVCQAPLRGTSGDRLTVLPLFACLFIGLGFALMGYFFLAFPVAAEGSNTVNIGLLNERLLGGIEGGIMALFGMLLAVYDAVLEVAHRLR